MSCSLFSLDSRDRTKDQVLFHGIFSQQLKDAPLQNICPVWVRNSPPFHSLKHPQGCMLTVVFGVSDAGVPSCGTKESHLTQRVVDFISQRQL